MGSFLVHPVFGEDPSHGQAQFMHAENVAQQLVDTPYLGIQITCTIRSVNLPEVWDQIIECISVLIYLQSKQPLKEKGILSESFLHKPSAHILAPLHSRCLCAGPAILLQLYW